MNVFLQFLSPDPLLLPWPLPQRAPLTCPFKPPNSLWTVQTLSDSPRLTCPLFASPSSPFLCHQPQGERKRGVSPSDPWWTHSEMYLYVYLKRRNSMLTGTAWTHRFLATVEIKTFLFSFKRFWVKTKVMSRVHPSRRWAGTSNVINLTPHYHLHSGVRRVLTSRSPIWKFIDCISDCLSTLGVATGLLTDSWHFLRGARETGLVQRVSHCKSSRVGCAIERMGHNDYNFGPKWKSSCLPFLLKWFSWLVHGSWRGLQQNQWLL